MYRLNILLTESGEQDKILLELVISKHYMFVCFSTIKLPLEVYRSTSLLSLCIILRLHYSSDEIRTLIIDQYILFYNCNVKLDRVYMVTLTTQTGYLSQKTAPKYVVQFKKHQ